MLMLTSFTKAPRIRMEFSLLLNTKSEESHLLNSSSLCFSSNGLNHVETTNQLTAIVVGSLGRSVMAHECILDIWACHKCHWVDRLHLSFSGHSYSYCSHCSRFSFFLVIGAGRVFQISSLPGPEEDKA